MKRKIVLLMMCIMTLVFVLSACGNSDENGGTPDVSQPNDNEETSTLPAGNLNIPGFPLADPVNVTVMGPHMGISDWDQMLFWQVLSEETNFTWDFVTPPNDDFATVLNLSMVGGEIPDVIFGGSLTAAQQIEHGSVGTLIPLQDLIADYAPNILRLLEENPNIRNSITAPDGNIYALPTINQSFDAIWPVGPVYYNGLWMEALDVEVPTTLDEFTDLMFRFRDEMPEILGVDQVFPISATDEMTWLRVWMLSFWGMTSRAIEAGDDGVVRHNAVTDAYRAFLEWMNMAFEEGLIHPEIFTLSGDQQSALGQDNLVGFFQSWHSQGFLGTDDVQALDNPMVRPIRSEWSPEGVLPRSPGFSFGQLAITNRAQDPAAIIRLFDWLYTEEGNIFANHGPEGGFWVYDTHEVTGEQVRVLAPDVDPEDGNAQGRFTPYFGFPAPGLITGNVPQVLRDVSVEIDTTFVDFLKAETEATMGAYGRVAMWPAMLTDEEAQSISIINTDLNMEINRIEAEFITGTREINDATWEDFVSTLDQIGLPELIDVWQEAHNRWREAAQ